MNWNRKYKRAALSALLVAAIAAASPLVLPLREAQCNPAAAVSVESPIRTGQVFYQNEGFRLFLSQEDDALLLTETKQADGMLFSVSEKASIEAQKALGSGAEGAGWLFAIGRVDEAEFRDMLCRDRSGQEIFAKDNQGNRYVFYHPTDVRFVRENSKAMARDQHQWTRLTQWAGQFVRGNFILDNLAAGLTEESYDNSMVSMALASAAYQPGTNYTVSTNEYGPLSPKGVAAAPYVERLIRNVEYKMVDSSETPDGEYVVLNFPDRNIRFDFFLMDGKENYVREVHEDGVETLYKAVFANGDIHASAVMQRWYWELAAHRAE